MKFFFVKETRLAIVEAENELQAQLRAGSGYFARTLANESKVEPGMIEAPDLDSALKIYTEGK